MLSIGDIKKETLIELDNQPHRVVEVQHVMMGRGGAVLRTKLKNLITGSVQERTFRPAEKIAPARVERVPMQFLYRDGSGMVFMNQDSFEQTTVGEGELGDQAKFIAEGSTVNLLQFRGRVIGSDMPHNVYLKVIHTEPGVRGDTATATLKPATVETGVTVQVPLFINQGDVIKVDTRTGAYLERQK